MSESNNVLLPSHKKQDDSIKLKIIHQSANFLVIDKAFDLVMNDNDPERFSLAHLIKRELPQLYDDKYEVNSLFALLLPPFLFFILLGLPGEGQKGKHVRLGPSGTRDE